MKVIVASTIVPFIEGGGTFIVDWLERTLLDRGHSVYTLKIPFLSDYRQMADQMLGLRLLDLSDHGDRLITIRTPSYLLKHPRKVLWFIHHHRTAYDLWDSPYREFPDTPEGLAYRDLMFSADMAAFREARSIFTNSKVVSQRLEHYNGVASEVLYPPLMRPERYQCRGYGDAIVYVSRVVGHKRQHLAVEAMRHTKTPVKLVLAGQAESDAVRERILGFVEKHGLEEKVVFMDAWISEEQKQTLLAECLGCMYIPLDEDSYGYPTLEAFHTRKPVITCSDSGGTLEIIVDGVNGFIAPPSPQRLAAAMDELYRNRARAQEMGEAGFRRLDELGISWDRVIGRLLA